MVTAGLLVHDQEHAATMVRFGLAMQQVAAQVMMPNGGGPVQMRIGIHSGPVLSGVIGKIRKRFCLVGHTVNCASRMESGGIPGRIQVSSSTHALLQHCSEFQWESRGPIEVKGLGTMTPYLLVPLDDQTMDILLSQDDVAEALSAVRGRAATAAEEPLTHLEYIPLQKDSLSYDLSERSSSPARLPEACTSCGLSNMSGVSSSSNATHASYLGRLPAIDCEDPLMWECTSAHAMHMWLSADMQRAQKGRTACSLAATQPPAAPPSQCDSASRPLIALGADTNTSTCCGLPGVPSNSQDNVASERTAQLAQQELEKEQALIAELDDVFCPQNRRRGSCIWGLTEDVQPHMLAANQVHRPPADVLGSHATVQTALSSFAFMQPGNDMSDSSRRHGRED
ncbi:nucleotide cyclase [Haematococcus lacustris]